MKALPQLLSCLLIASVALLNSGVAWSGSVQANEGLTKSSAGTTHKKAKKSPKKAKTAQKKTKKYHSQAKPGAQAPAAVVPPAVAENAYLPSATAPIVAKANSYLPAATAATAAAITATNIAAATSAAAVTPPGVAASVVATASAPGPDVAKEIPATPAAPLALAKSLTLASAPAGAPAEAQVAQTSNPWSAGGEASGRTQPQKADSIIAKPTGNPYLAYNATYNTAYSQPFTPFNPAESLGQLFSGLMFSLPSLPSFSQTNKAGFNQASVTPNATAGLGNIFSSLREYLPEPHLPSADIDILPSIKKVYPTGEKPLVVLTFKCPTELIGITPLPTKALRWLISSGMEAVNSTNLLSFNMQQVCQ